MMELLPCASCGSLLSPRASACAHCGATRTSSGRPGALAAALLLGLAFVPGGCHSGQAIYGVELVDADGDGFVDGEDCDDDNVEINPDAEETPGDDVDSNCDGEDDT